MLAATKRFDFGQREEAISIFSRVLDRQPDSIKRIMDYSFRLYEQGRASHARSLLKALQSHSSVADKPYWSLGARYAIACELGDERQKQKLETESRRQLQGLKAADNRWLNGWTVP